MDNEAFEMGEDVSYIYQNTNEESIKQFYFSTNFWHLTTGWRLAVLKWADG